MKIKDELREGALSNIFYFKSEQRKEIINKQAKELEHSVEQICTERLGFSKDHRFVGGSYLVQLHHSL